MWYQNILDLIQIWVCEVQRTELDFFIYLFLFIFLFYLFYKGGECNCWKRVKKPSEESGVFIDQTLKLNHLLCCTVVINTEETVRMTVTFTILLEISFQLLYYLPLAKPVPILPTPYQILIWLVSRCLSTATLLHCLVLYLNMCYRTSHLWKQHLSVKGIFINCTCLMFYQYSLC